MPQMSPMYWLFYPIIMMMLVIMSVVTLCKEDLEMGKVEVLGVLNDEKSW